jgi:hypothetical protein
MRRRFDPLLDRVNGARMSIDEGRVEIFERSLQRRRSKIASAQQFRIS